MHRSFRCPPLLASVLVALFLGSPGAASAQGGGEEPVLAQARDVFSQPGLTLRFLARINADAGLEEEVTRATVNQARLRVQGVLDGGFDYLVQTNFASSDPLLDARVGWGRDARFHVWAGRFKTPYSQEFIDYVRDIDFVYRSRVVSDLAPNRQIGLQLGGALSDLVSWSLGGFTGQRNATPNEPLLGVARIRAAGIEVGEGTLQVAFQGAVGRDGAIAPRPFGQAWQGDGSLFGVDARLESGPLLVAAEVHDGRWTPDVGAEVDALGWFVTGGWSLTDLHQLLLRWDRYRSPGTGAADDVLVLGYNARPTSVVTLQANWQIPLDETAQPDRLVFTFQMGN